MRGEVWVTDIPPKLAAARELAILAQDCDAELQWLVLALSILHGTFHDPHAPRDYTPSFRVAIPMLRHSAGLEVDREAMVDAAADDLARVLGRFLTEDTARAPIPKSQLN
jgi:hypothetical protein